MNNGNGRTSASMDEFSEDYLLIVYWQLKGHLHKGKPGYRSENPWQSCEHFMEESRGDAARFFDRHEIRAIRVDRTVWRIEIRGLPTVSGMSIDELARKLVESLADQINEHEDGDHIAACFAHGSNVGRIEWNCN